MPETLTTLDVILRLLVAFILSALIGAEREYYKKPAGLRTLVMVGVGSALFTLVSFRIRDLFPGALVDPSRIAAQVVTGIGFLGAGTIIRAKGSIVGLTTAATTFAVAAIGMAAAYGLYVEAVATTVLVLVTFYGLSFVVFWLRQRSKIPSQLEDEEEVENQNVVMH